MLMETEKERKLRDDREEREGGRDRKIGRTETEERDLQS